MRTRRVCASLLAVVLAACGQTRVSSNGLLGGARAALGTCDIGGLVDASSCEGPWEYHRYLTPCYASARGAACGIQSADTCYPTCRHMNGGPFGFRYLYPWHLGRSCDPKPPFCDNHCYCSPDNLAGSPAAISAAGYPDNTFSKVGDNVAEFSCNTLPRDGCFADLSVQAYTTDSNSVCGPGTPCNIVYNQCRDASFGLDPNLAACGEDGVDYISPPGESVATLQAGAAPPSYMVNTAGNAGCLSCDTLSLFNSGDVQAKYTCLTAALAKYSAGGLAADPALSGKLIKKLKLLFELRGTDLTDTQRATILPLFQSDSADTYCTHAWNPPVVGPTCAQMATVTSLNATLAFCSEMADAQVTAGVAELALPQCLNAVAPIATLSAACNFTAYRSAYLALTTALVAKAMGNFTDQPTDADRPAQISNRLSVIQSWYGVLRGQLYKTGAPPAAVLGSVSQVLKAFWQSVYVNQLAQQSAASAQGYAVTTGMVADEQVLAAAFGSVTGTPPLGGAPLAMLVGDALTTLHDRMGQISSFHDMGCRFETCLTPTNLSEYWGVLATLGDKTRLTASVNLATHIPDWVASFRLMATQHASLEAAILDAFGLPPAAAYSPLILETTALDMLPPPVSVLAAMVRDGTARMGSFNARSSPVSGTNSGMFSPAARNQVSVGLNKEKQADILQELSSIIAQLEQARADYNTNRLQYVQALVAQLQNQTSAANISGEAVNKYLQVLDLSRDLSGQQIQAGVDEARYGDFMRGFAGLEAGIGASADYSPHPQPLINLSASDARFLTGASTLAAVAVSHGGTVWKLQPGVGDVVSVSTNGDWAPVCALSHTAMPDGKNPDVTGARTGPEGFSVTLQSGKFLAKSNATVNSNGDYINGKIDASVCAGFHAGSPLPGLTGNQAYIEVKACVSAEAGLTHQHNNSTTDSSGNETRSTISFAQGLRSLNTPFPDQPVGSLLLVQVARGATGIADAKRVQVVVAPSTSLVIDVDSDVYLVVNDLSGPGCTPTSTPSLTVQVTLLQSATAAARQMAGAMAATLADFSNLSPGVIAQGTILPDQPTQWRNAALNEIYLRCRCTTLNGYPDSLKNLFNTFVDKQIVAMERAVQVANISRQLKTLLIDLQTLSADELTAGAQGRLLSLAPAWALQNLDGLHLQVQVQALSQVLSSWIDPIIRIKDPETLASFSKIDLSAIDALVNVSPTDDISVLADRAGTAANLIERRLELVRIAAPAPIFQSVVLSYARPGRAALSSFKKASAQSANAAWTDILAGRNLRLRVTPEDLYSPTGGVGVLTCSQSVPNINAMMLYVDNNSPVPKPSFSLPSVIGEDMTFPSTTELLHYQFVNGSYLAPAIQLDFGKATDALTHAQAYWAQPGSLVGTGLSPFSDIQINLQSINAQYPSSVPGTLSPNNPLSLATEFMVVLRLEPRAEAPGTPLPGVPGCF